MITEIKKNGLDLKKFNLTLDNLKSANQALEYYSKKNIQNNVTKIDSSSYILKNEFLDNPTEVLIRSFSELLLMIGKKKYPARGKALKSLIKDLSKELFIKTTLSGCVIEKVGNSLIIAKEMTK